MDPLTGRAHRWQRLRALVPRALRPQVRLLWLRLLDAADAVTGRRPPMVPPRRRIEQVGGLDFGATGRHLLEVAVHAGRLRADESVLDAGCGIGRFAVPLTAFLTAGSYRGFDLDRAAIRWCRSEITARFPRFRFTCLDVRNSYYNPRGRMAPEAVVFPYDEGEFDFVLAASLFTHLAPAAARRYLEQCARVLRPGGRLLASFFLLGADGGDNGTAKLRFGTPLEGMAVADASRPEAAVAYTRRWLEDASARAGFELQEVHRGFWRGDGGALSYQDFVLAVRPVPGVLAAAAASAQGQSEGGRSR